MAAPSPTAPLRVARHRSIQEVDEALWDSINSDQDIFHQHRFIRAVEAARVEDSQAWYLLFYRGDRLVATAALSAFTVSLDLFVGGAAAQLIQRLRRWWPEFLRIRILFCGLPISLGQNNLVVADPAQAGEVLALLVREMAEVARALGIQYLCVKEFLQSQIAGMDGLEKHGYFLANSIPYVSMPLRWPSFEAYLASLRHGYRRPIKLALKKIGQTSPAIERANGDGPAAAAPRLVLGGPEVCPPSRFFELYMQVMERAPVKLETLNLPFFEQLYTHMRHDLAVLAFVQEREVLGSALLTTHNGAMTFMLVGLDYARRDQYDVYFNLVYGIISLAIEQGCRELHLGQTSYWLKQRVGGECIPEYFYFKSNRRFVHFCIRSLRAALFPEVKPRRPTVFRQADLNGTTDEHGR